MNGFRTVSPEIFWGWTDNFLRRSLRPRYNRQGTNGARVPGRPHCARLLPTTTGLQEGLQRPGLQRPRSSPHVKLADPVSEIGSAFLGQNLRPRKPRSQVECPDIEVPSDYDPWAAGPLWGGAFCFHVSRSRFYELTLVARPFPLKMDEAGCTHGLMRKSRSVRILKIRPCPRSRRSELF